jgi:para-aminobenzoate synthetase / 4-amino-4-deoxychorismate lyase
MQPEPPDPSLGVFETLLVFDGRVQASEAHLERLAGSVAELYELDLPADLLGMTMERARELMQAHRLRIDAIPDGGRLRVEFQATPLDGADASAVVCTPVQVPGGLGSHKWSDRRLLDSLAGPGRFPLLVDTDGDVLETSVANVWLLEAGKLVTPPADGRLLPGVTRALLIALGPLNGLDVRVEPVSLERMRAAAQIFLTSSLRHAVAATLEPEVTLAPAATSDSAQTPAPGAPSILARIRALLATSSWA